VKRGEGIKWDVAELADTVFMDNYNAALRHFNSLTAESLLVMAWEHVKPKHRRDPVAQFLRHCRNAAAHNGVFTFNRGQPDKPAEWHGVKIVRALEGSPLFINPPRKGFLGPGDVLYLLADIEEKSYTEVCGVRSHKLPGDGSSCSGS
jgi:hypothetical protein